MFQFQFSVPISSTAATAPASTAVTVSSTATASASSAVFLLHQRTCFVDGEFAAVQFRTVEFGDRVFCGFVFHLHKTESLRSSCHTVGDDADRIHLTDLSKQVVKILL